MTGVLTMQAQRASDGNWPEVWIALGSAGAGALFGGALAIITQIVLNKRLEDARFRTLMRALTTEIRGIALEVALGNSDGNTAAPPSIRQPSPLATDVWQVLLSSGVVTRLPSEDIAALAEFYRLVRNANYLASLAPFYIQTANLSADDVVQDMFTAEARRITSEPFAAVHRAAAAAGDVVGAHGGKS